MSITSKECYHQLAPDLKICRIVNGMWQVAGGHGYIDHELAIEDMMRYHETGFTTWDLADIYGPAEDFIGKFRLKLSTLKGKEELNKIQALTKWVPQPRELSGKKNIFSVILFLSDVYNSIEQSSFIQEELQLYFEQFYVLLASCLA
jgi:predicted oxidoreductase